MKTPTKPLRQTMPTVAAWVDELRAAFGADAINPAIRNGAAGGSHFYAEENGHAIGCEAMPGSHVVSVEHMVLIRKTSAVGPSECMPQFVAWNPGPVLASLPDYAPIKREGAGDDN